MSASVAASLTGASALPPAAAVPARALAPSSVYLVIDARLRLGDSTAASTVSDAAAAAVWRQLLSFLHCQALLAATRPSQSDWCMVAVHDEAGNASEDGVVEWLVRQPLLVGDLRQLLQRSRLPLASSSAPASQPQSAALVPGTSPADARSAIEPILVALKAIMKRQQDEAHPNHQRWLQQQQQQQPLRPVLHSGRPASLPCHVILFSPHLFSQFFVRQRDLFEQSLARLGTECGFSFRLLHLRCNEQQLALSSPLLTALQGASYVRGSARSDGVTSSACQQPQQVWSIASSLPPVEPLYATLIISDTSSDPLLSALWDGGAMEDEWVGGGGGGVDSGGLTWDAVFNDQADASVWDASEGVEVLRIPVLLMPVVRRLPLPVDVQVSYHSARCQTGEKQHINQVQAIASFKCRCSPCQPSLLYRFYCFTAVFRAGLPRARPATELTLKQAHPPATAAVSDVGRW